MLVLEVMSIHPVTVREGTPVKEALRLLADHHITVMPVVTESGMVVGVVSEADLIREVLPLDPRAHEIPPAQRGPRARVVDEVMRVRVLAVHPDTDLAEAVELLVSSIAKSVPVVDRDGHLEGVLSRSDVVRLLARPDDEIGREVDRLLRSTGLMGWLVDVSAGTVELIGPDEDATTARLLAGTIPGVLEVIAREGSS
jgi:CBS domain-containing protein